MKKTLWEMCGDHTNRVAFIAATIALHGKQADGDGFNAYQAARVAESLTRRATSIHSLCEADCNYGLSDRQEKRLEALCASFTAIAEASGFVATTGGDPRGACAYIAVAGVRGDDMGERGFAVYR